MTASPRFSWRSIVRFLLGCLEDLGRSEMLWQGVSPTPWTPPVNFPEDVPSLRGPPSGHPEIVCGRPMDEAEREIWSLLGEWDESH